jgi:hypothetical protein
MARLLFFSALLPACVSSPPLDAAAGRALLASLPALEHRVGNLSATSSRGSSAALAALPAALEALADAQGALRRHGAAAASRAAALRAVLRASGGAAPAGALVLSYAQQAKDLQGALRFDEALAMVARARDAGARGGGLPPAAVASLDAAESELLDCVGDAAGALAAFERSGGGGGGGGAAAAALHLVDLLRKAAAATPPGPAAEALRAREDAAVARLLAAGPWERPRQLPKTYVRGLHSAPWHAHSGEGARWRALTEPAAAALEAATGALAAEFFALQRAGRLLEETECVHVGGGGGGGTWRWFATNGFWEEQGGDGCAAAAPAACALLARLRAEAPALRVLRAGYSAIDGRVHLRPHCGWTNAQLKMHLGLVVPRAGGGGGGRRKRRAGAARGEPCARLRVGNETRAWEEGRVLMFDDSWEHEVTHACDSVRVVFQLVFAHPDADKLDQLPAAQV